MGQHLQIQKLLKVKNINQMSFVQNTKSRAEIRLLFFV